jgi:hypothetical protein
MRSRGKTGLHRKDCGLSERSFPPESRAPVEPQQCRFRLGGQQRDCTWPCNWYSRTKTLAGAALGLSKWPGTIALWPKRADPPTKQLGERAATLDTARRDNRQSVPQAAQPVRFGAEAFITLPVSGESLTATGKHAPNMRADYLGSDGEARGLPDLGSKRRNVPDHLRGIRRSTAGDFKQYVPFAPCNVKLYLTSRAAETVSIALEESTGHADIESLTAVRLTKKDCRVEAIFWQSEKPPIGLSFSGHRDTHSLPLGAREYGTPEGCESHPTVQGSLEECASNLNTVSAAGNARIGILQL